MRRRGRRQRFSLEQKRQIVEATLEPGASVARVARERGVNANQVFAWRRAYKQGLLEDRGAIGVQLLPVHVANAATVDSLIVPETTQPPLGAIHIELPGKAMLTVEGRPDGKSLRMVLEYLLR